MQKLPTTANRSYAKGPVSVDCVQDEKQKSLDFVVQGFVSYTHCCDSLRDMPALVVDCKDKAIGIGLEGFEIIIATVVGSFTNMRIVDIRNSSACSIVADVD